MMEFQLEILKGNLQSSYAPSVSVLTRISSLRESTASLSSSILEYRDLHGRKYQSSKTTEYW